MRSTSIMAMCDFFGGTDRVHSPFGRDAFDDPVRSVKTPRVGVAHTVAEQNVFIQGGKKLVYRLSSLVPRFREDNVPVPGNMNTSSSVHIIQRNDVSLYPDSNMFL